MRSSNLLLLISGLHDEAAMMMMQPGEQFLKGSIFCAATGKITTAMHIAVVVHFCARTTLISQQTRWHSG
jgi:hypothetical protein